MLPLVKTCIHYLRFFHYIMLVKQLYSPLTSGFKLNINSCLLNKKVMCFLTWPSIPDLPVVFSLFMLHLLTSSFAAVIITSATRDLRQTTNINLGCNMLFFDLCGCFDDEDRLLTVLHMCHMKRQSHGNKTAKIQFPQTLEISSHAVGQGDIRFVVTLWTPDKITCVCEYTAGFLLSDSRINKWNGERM